MWAKAWPEPAPCGLVVGEVFLDEVDVCGGDVDDEGDPVALAMVHTRIFGSRPQRHRLGHDPRVR